MLCSMWSMMVVWICIVCRRDYVSSVFLYVVGV